MNRYIAMVNLHKARDKVIMIRIYNVAKLINSAITKSYFTYSLKFKRIRSSLVIIQSHTE